jgi:hypothetical protein
MEDGKSRGIGRPPEEEHIGIGLPFHGGTILTNVDIDKYQYR